MQKWILSPLLLILLLATISHAQETPSNVLLSKQTIILEGGDYELRAYVLFNPQYLKPDKTGKPLDYSPGNAVVTFYEHTIIPDGPSKGDRKKTPISGCDMVPASTSEVNPDTGITLYYAKCLVPASFLEKKNLKRITAEIVSPSYYAGPSIDFYLSSEGSETLRLFSKNLEVGIGNKIKENLPLCVAAFAILGLLLSSMYFSGKSPLSLLDITTPRLPSPKSVAAAGSNLGQMVYGRMKKITAETMGKIQKVLDLASKDSINKLTRKNPAMVGSIKKELEGISDPETKSLLSIVAFKMAEKGDSLSKIRGFLRKKPLHAYTQEEHSELGKIINRLRTSADKSHNLVESEIANNMDNYINAYVNMNKMKILTGEGALGPQSRIFDTAYKLARIPVDGMKNVPLLNKVPILKDIPGLGRTMLLGPFIGTSIDALFRSMRISARLGRAVTGGVVRTVTGIKGKQLEEYKKVAQSPETPWLRRQIAETIIAGSPISVKVGVFVPIHQQMEEMYKTLYSESHNDVLRYLLKRIFEHHGANFDLKEADMVDFGYKPIDLIKVSGLDSSNSRMGRLREIEVQLKKVLSRTTATDDPNEYPALLNEKIAEVRKIADKAGVKYDRSFDFLLARLHDIHEGPEEAPAKLLTLYDYLINTHHINQPFGPDIEERRAQGKFYLTVGRDSLTYRTKEGHEVFSDLWEVRTLRQYMWDAENGYLNGGVEDVVKANYVYLVNRLIGHSSRFPDASGKTDKNVEAIVRQVGQYLKDLLTPAGFKAAADVGLSPDNAPRALLSGHELFKRGLGGANRDLYVKFGDLGADSKIAKLIKEQSLGAADLRGIEQTLGRRMAPIGFKDKRGKIQFYEEDSENPPSAEWWKADMKRDWKPGNDPSGRETVIREYVEALFAKTKNFSRLPHAVAIERELGGDLTPANVEQYKKLMARQIMATEVYDFLNGVLAMNAYKYTHETMRLLTKQAQGLFYGFLLKKAEDQGGEYRSLAREVEGMALTSGANQSHEFKRLSELMHRHNAEFSEYLKAPLDYGSFTKSKHAWVLFHEGGLAPYVDGMPMSDFDRVMNGYTAINDNGKWRRFDPMRVDLEKDLPQNLKNQLKYLANNKDPDASVPTPEGILTWKGLIGNMKEWAGNDLDRQKAFGGVLWRYAETTSDWHSFWSDTKITIRPKSEVLPTGRFMPFSSHKEWPDFVTEPLRKVREASRSFGQWFERMSMYSGAPVYAASYDITNVSEQFKQRLWSSNTRILSSSFEEQMKANRTPDELKSALVDLANMYPKYHIVWIGGIDRNPWGFSTSYGLQSGLGSYFHYGSASMWDFRWYRPMMDTKDWIPFSLFTFPIKANIALGTLFYRAFRGAQMSGWGYPSRWEYTGSSMQPFTYATPSKLGMLRSFFNPFYATLDWFRAGEVTATGRKFGFMNSARGVLTGLIGSQELIRRDLGGQKYVRGIASAPMDVQWIHKGEHAVARYGAANPASGHYNQRWELKLASRPAQYLAQGHEAFSGYFATVPEITSRAYNIRVKREVAGPALALKREEELRGFGPMVNSLWAWVSPALFVWHLPISPISPASLYQNYKSGKRLGNWESLDFASKTAQVLKGSPQTGGFLRDFWAKVKPYTHQAEGIKYINLLTKDMVGCPRCGRMIHRLTWCPNCKAGVQKVA